MSSQLRHKLLLLNLIFIPILKQVVSTPKLTENDQCYIGEKIIKPLQFISPLQTFTIFNKDCIEKSPRKIFFPKFRAGILAEKMARDTIAKTSEMCDDGEVSNEMDLSKMAGKVDAFKEKAKAKKIERLYNNYMNRLFPNDSVNTNGKVVNKKSVSKYQIVGIVRPPSIGGKAIDWYARKRPANSKWYVRLVHPNRDAILRDLFIHGKIDIYGEYINTGKVSDQLGGDNNHGQIPIGVKPLIEGKYTIRKRSWRNLWNFSPRNFLTDSSGSFWRQRRILPGLYTDGHIVFKSSYRYTDGKNGMKPLFSLDELLNSNTINEKVKFNLLHRLKNDSPDIVVEY